MMKLLKNKKGFTLLELLIVLVIIGVIAGLMFPVLTSQIEKSRAQEAVTALGTVKEKMAQYYNTNGSYVGAILGVTGTGNIGFNPNTTAGGQTAQFSYVLSNVQATTGAAPTWTCTATASPLGRGGSTAADTIVITENGDVARNGLYK